MTYKTLISAAELREHRESTWIIVDCRFSLAVCSAGLELGYAHYEEQHLPGAFYAHLDNDLSSPITSKTGRHPLPDFDRFANTVNSWGVGSATQIVAYDDAGGPFASRLWWLLTVCGHEQVAVLDGGIAAWEAAGGELTAAASEATPRSNFYDLRPQREQWLEVNEIEDNLTDERFKLIDARTVERYLGDAEPLDTVAGRIPGALNLPVPNNLDQGHFKSKSAIRENFLAIADESTLVNSVHYCGSGVFACHNVLSMEYAGLGRTRLYPGSWSEWIREQGRDKVGRFNIFKEY